MLKNKLFKLVDDPCFGKKWKEIENCEHCWINKSCSVRYKNRKD